jgi:hypothetical protein
MTALSETLKNYICKYCVNAHTGKCAADIPWYAVSYDCASYKEAREQAIPVPRRKVDPLRYLVETI